MRANHFISRAGILIVAMAMAVFVPASGIAQQAEDMTGRPEMQKTEPMQAESVQAEPVQAESAQAETAQAETAQADTPIFIGPTALRLVQQELQGKGYYQGPIDGVWGSNTASGISRFQKALNLEPNGNLDIETIHALGVTEILKSDPAMAGTEEKLELNGQGVQLYLSSSSLKEIQQSLKDQGFKVEEANGKWNDQTQRAVLDFQKQKGSEATGHITLPMLSTLGMDRTLAALGFSAGSAETGEPAMAESTPREDSSAAQAEWQAYIQQLEKAGLAVKSESASDTRAQTGTGEETAEETRAYYGEADKSAAYAGGGAPLFAGTETIRQVQQALKDEGFNPGNVDGKWSESTEGALHQYQAKNNMDKTGNLTLAALNKLVGGDIESGEQQQQPTQQPQQLEETQQQQEQQQQQPQQPSPPQQ